MFRRILNILLNPFFQAFLVSLLIICLVPFGFNKYKAQLEESQRCYDEGQYSYADLDNDGYSEKIFTARNLVGNVAVTILSRDKVLGQWNFRGNYQSHSTRFMTGDFDGNGLSEIYLFTFSSDSIFLNCLEKTDTSARIRFSSRFIATVGTIAGKIDHTIIPGKVTDLDGDGFGELVFAITAGFSKIPRNVFAYDIMKDTFLVSPKSGYFIQRLIVEDINRDDKDEIIISLGASTDNIHDALTPYPDQSCWVMVLDQKLKFIFPPLEFPGIFSQLIVTPYCENSGKAQLVGFYARDGELSLKNILFSADVKGNIIRRVDFDGPNPLSRSWLVRIPGNAEPDWLYTIDDGKSVHEIRPDMSFGKRHKIKISYHNWVIVDADADGNYELLAVAKENDHHLLLRSDLRDPVRLDFPQQQGIPVVMTKLNGNDPPQLFIQGSESNFLFDYGLNPSYPLRYLVYLGVFLSILAFIIIIRKLYGIQLRKKYETEQKITRLQLSGIKAQMEPHFIMNTINTIGSSIYRHNEEEAYRQLINFSGMVRSLLVSSDKLTRSIKEENEFVRNYLELEKSRFSELFNFSINISDNVNPETIIPKMIIQIHAENALKHGIRPKKSGGIIDISISREPDDLAITIKDNGIGRSAAEKNKSQSTGRGMKIIDQLFETYNKHNRRPLRQEIIDLYDDEQHPAGTLVKIYVPLDFNEGIY